jgi:hypothetical protein
MAQAQVISGAQSSLLYAERRDYLKHIRDAGYSLDEARIVLVAAMQRLEEGHAASEAKSGYNKGPGPLSALVPRFLPGVAAADRPLPFAHHLPLRRLVRGGQGDSPGCSRTGASPLRQCCEPGAKSSPACLPRSLHRTGATNGLPAVGWSQPSGHPVFQSECGKLSAQLIQLVPPTQSIQIQK